MVWSFGPDGNWDCGLSLGPSEKAILSMVVDGMNFPAFTVAGRREEVAPECWSVRSHPTRPDQTIVVSSPNHQRGTAS